MCVCVMPCALEGLVDRCERLNVGLDPMVELDDLQVRCTDASIALGTCTEDDEEYLRGEVYC